jgi:hypothetical protein
VTGEVRRSFLLGRNAGSAVADERRLTFELLAQHERVVAALTLTHSARSAFNDYLKMRSAMLAGGLHRVRLNGGRNLDR